MNNAGVAGTPYTKTIDGNELQFQTNYLGHFLLTELLLPLIQRSGTKNHQSRIINVSSEAHRFGFIMWHDLNATRFYNSSAAYAQSKLAQVLHTKALARKLEVCFLNNHFQNINILTKFREKLISSKNSVFSCISKQIHRCIVFILELL